VSAEDPGVGEEPETARGWGSLLRTNRPFSYLFLATAGSATGTYLAALALSIHVYDLTGSQTWIAALLVADFLPIIVIGLTLGPLVDRLRRRGLLIAADLVRVGVFALLPFVDSPTGIVALAAVGGVATGFFRPAVWAGLPNLVPERDRESATALFSTTENVAWIAGPILAAFLTVSGNPDPAYWVNAASFLVSALLIARIRASALQSSDPLTRGHWRDVRDGLGLVLRSRPLRTVLLVWSTAGIASAGVNVGEVALAKEAFDAGNWGFAALVVATGIGLVTGSYLAGSLVGTVGMTRLYGGSLLVMAIGFGTAAIAPWIELACALAALGGVGNGSALVCNQLLVQRGSSDSMRGRSLAVLMSVYYACLGLGMATAGLLGDALGARWVWGIAGCVYAVAAVIAFAMTRAARAEATASLREGNGQPAEGRQRLEALLGEIEATHEHERTRPQKALPYIPRKRTD